ncbi:transcription regulator [Cryptosporidium sp. chipmunk genotype I]|uniref:transcription regulator n=1 Tax=Cryptosporidium sp. chipmunk genotype I TaxID=1280935 RepID=UPI00351A8D39|nr:transcription regulator [Cryptosporidium sp. chipmunk genotype I]
MISGKLQIFVLGFFLTFLGVFSESSLLSEGTVSLSRHDNFNEQSKDNTMETSSSPLFPEKSASNGSLSEAIVENTSDSSLVESSKSISPTNLASSTDISKSEQTVVEDKSGLFTENLDEKQEESASTTVPVNLEYSISKGSEGSSSPLVEKSKSKTDYEKLLEDHDTKYQSEYSPKNQEESIMLLDDPNYTVDDALALLRKQRKIHESAREKNKKSAENFGSEYEFDRIESPAIMKYDESSRSKEDEQSISTNREAQPDEEELTFFPKELSLPKENERESSAPIRFTSNFETSKKESSPELSRSSFDKSHKEPEAAGVEESEPIALDKSNEETEDSNPYEIPVSEKSGSIKSVEDEMSNLGEKSISEKEKTLSSPSESTISLSNQVSQEDEQSGVEEEKDLNEPQIISIPSSVNSVDNDEVKESQPSEDNEASKSPKIESPIIGTESESETENDADNSNQALNEADTSSDPSNSGPEVPPEIDEENSLNRVLESKEQSGVDDFSQVEFMEGSQKSPQPDKSPLLNTETFRNEDSSNKLRGILLPLVDMFQVAIGCAAPCPYQRYFIQTDRILKRIAKTEAKTIELLNIMKKAREITIKEVSDIFKFHNTAVKRRALLFVQKYIKSIKLLHFKIDSAKKTVLLAMKVRILLQLLPSKYSGEYSSEELERLSSQIELALKEYSNIRSALGSKTIKYGLVKYLSLNDYDPKIKSIRSILEAELSNYVAKLPAFQKFVSRHRKLAFALHDMMNKAGYPVKKRFFMVDRKGLSKEHFTLYKKKVNEDSRQAKNRLGKEYSRFKNSQENKWKAFTKKVNSS